MKVSVVGLVEWVLEGSSIDRLGGGGLANGVERDLRRLEESGLG